MDDLLSEDWQKPTKPTTSTPSNAAAFASNYSSLRASPQLPLSGTASPQNLSRPSSTVNGMKSPAKDTFGNLLSLKSQKPGSNLSLQERQRQLLEEKKKQQDQQAQLWDTLGSGRGTPEIRHPSPAVPSQDDEDDILAAFNKNAPVDNASYFSPPQSEAVSGRSTPAIIQPTPRTTESNGDFDEDDDPFELSEASKRSNGHVKAPSPALDDNDDILGDLGRPVTGPPPSTRTARAPSVEEPMLEQEPASPETDGDDAPQDRSLAELVDMGFPADTAKIALAENGGDVQSAVGWLLQQAHEESKQKARVESQSQRRTPLESSRSPQRKQRGEQDTMPAWMRQEGRPSSAPRRQDSRSPTNGDKDPTQVAQEFGNKLFKSANSIWKASQKQMAKTVAEFQQETDAGQPKWMRGTSTDPERPSSQRRTQQQPITRSKPIDVTDEAAALDAPREIPQKPPRPVAPPQPIEAPLRGRSPVEPLPHRPPPQPKFMQQPAPQPDRRPMTKLSRQEVEDQVAQAYVSPARRKRPIPKPEPQPAPELDLFSAVPPKASPVPVARNAPPRPAQAPPASRPSPAPQKAKAPPRSIPPVSPTALSTSASHRKVGGEHYKRGDYAAAHDSYTAALHPLPPTHPIAIIVLSNHSLTALKTGDAKTSVSDADRALDLIGPTFGIGETIDLGAGEGTKEMREFYGKALMRKAEALEHMEKYPDAATIWRQAIEAGIGGAVSLRGRDRCDKAAAPKAAAPKPVRSSAPGPGKFPPTKSLGNSLQRPSIPSPVSAEAVRKLRAANAEADKADDEKFALTDAVDAKLTAWRGGKVDNLRALLQSMDAVLWEEAGWKKVGMSDLVVPGKVKVVYMKAIGKVHPDKVSESVVVLVRRLSAAGKLSLETASLCRQLFCAGNLSLVAASPFLALDSDGLPSSDPVADVVMADTTRCDD